MNQAMTRRWLIRWLYAAVLVHLLVGIVITVAGDARVFDAYHNGVVRAFWGNSAPSAARALNSWWVDLFGATVQAVSLWMGALVYLGNRHRSTFAWGWLFVGIAIWAPQDIVISLRATCWPNVLADAAAVVTLLPPLAWLWRYDGKSHRAGSSGGKVDD